MYGGIPCLFEFEKPGTVVQLKPVWQFGVALQIHLVLG
jgi:hypothetical protein